MSKYYGVVVGRERGIFTSWPDCKIQVSKFKDAKYKAFKTRQEADWYVRTDGYHANCPQFPPTRMRRRFPMPELNMLPVPMDDSKRQRVYCSGFAIGNRGGVGVVFPSHPAMNISKRARRNGPTTKEGALLQAILCAINATEIKLVAPSALALPLRSLSYSLTYTRFRARGVISPPCSGEPKKPRCLSRQCEAW